MLIEKESLQKPSVLILIIVNIIPLIGVLFFGWNVFAILLLYWFESAIIGFFNIIKMSIVVRRTLMDDVNINFGTGVQELGKLNKIMSVISIPFFILHFGIFMIVHLIFILLFFSMNSSAHMDFFQAFAAIPSILGTAIIGAFFLFLSHLYSFIFTYMRKNEYVNERLFDLSLGPYSRVIIMQAVLFGSGFAATGLGAPSILIALMVILKIIFDIESHEREHRKN